MSLVGYKGQNHPQQTDKRGALDEVDDRGTHPIHFAEFDAEFGPFTLDVAAAPHNAKCARYFTRAEDGLARSWADERVWCNPPYSNLNAWLEKAWAELDDTLGIVMLLPANRVEQKWWQEHVEPHRDRPDGRLRVRFLPGRMRFERPGATVGPKGDRPPFGCCLLIFTPTRVHELGCLAIRGWPCTCTAPASAPPAGTTDDASHLSASTRIAGQAFSTEGGPASGEHGAPTVGPGLVPEHIGECYAQGAPCGCSTAANGPSRKITPTPEEG